MMYIIILIQFKFTVDLDKVDPVIDMIYFIVNTKFYTDVKKWEDGWSGLNKNNN